MKRFQTTFFCWVATLAAVLPTALQAQSPVTNQVVKTSARPIPPNGILLATPPDHMQWVITYTYGLDHPKKGDSTTSKAAPIPIPASAPAKTIINRTGDIIHEVNLDQAGNFFEKWQVGKTDYIKFSGETVWGVCNAASRSMMMSVPAEMQNVVVNKFVGLEWVNINSYAGMLQQNNQTILLFIPAESGDINLKSSDALGKEPVIAYISGETHLPIAYRNHDILMNYAFTPVSGVLALPVDLQNQIRKEQEATAKLFAPVKREY